MAIIRDDEIVETVVERAPTETIEERVVNQDGTVTRVVRTVGEETPVFVPTAVVERPVARRVISRLWRRTSTPVQATTEYTAVGRTGFGGQPTLGQSLRTAWFFVALLEGALALRFGLALLGANANNPFAALVYAVTWPFVAPFQTLFGVPAAGGSVLETYTLVAMLAVVVVWWMGVKLIGVMMNRRIEA